MLVGRASEDEKRGWLVGWLVIWMRGKGREGKERERLVGWLVHNDYDGDLEGRRVIGGFGLDWIGAGFVWIGIGLDCDWIGLDWTGLDWHWVILIELDLALDFGLDNWGCCWLIGCLAGW